jgi:hypothetical protein
MYDIVYQSAYRAKSMTSTTADRLIDLIDAVEMQWLATHPDHSAESKTALSRAVDELVAELVRGESPPPDPIALRELFNRTHPDKVINIGEQLATLDASLVPVFVMRVVMRRKGIDFDAAQVPHWETFLERYGMHILHALHPNLSS